MKRNVKKTFIKKIILTMSSCLHPCVIYVKPCNNVSDGNPIYNVMLRSLWNKYLLYISRVNIKSQKKYFLFCSFSSDLPILSMMSLIVFHCTCEDNIKKITSFHYCCLPLLEPLHMLWRSIITLNEGGISPPPPTPPPPPSMQN